MSQSWCTGVEGVPGTKLFLRVLKLEGHRGPFLHTGVFCYLLLVKDSLHVVGNLPAPGTDYF